jgi:hypothetical protein
MWLTPAIKIIWHSPPKENAHLANFPVLPPRAAKIIPSKRHRCRDRVDERSGGGREALPVEVGGEGDRPCCRPPVDDLEGLLKPSTRDLLKTKTPLRRALRSTSYSLEEGGLVPVNGGMGGWWRCEETARRAALKRGQNSLTPRAPSDTYAEEA